MKDDEKCNGWNDLENEKPKPGQRCIVWDEDRQAPVFAYFERRGFFFRPNIGETKVIDGKCWMPQPVLKNGENDD